MRYLPFAFIVILTLLIPIAATFQHENWYWLLLIILPLALLGVWDIFQTKHNLLRNYPLLAHLRWVFEGIRPEIRQYLVESDTEAIPFNREQRALVYERAKDTVDVHPFGTDLDVYSEKYAWLNHSVVPTRKLDSCFCVKIGGEQCNKPYSASVYNISAMSFGALSANAIRALNKGAKLGNFAHDTGEGSISRYHREFGGDLIWEIGTGYFGCRNNDGTFNAEMFAEQASIAQVRMIEIKLSQGAKPGHGGLLPGHKVSVEIAAARHVPVGVDCLSPAGHSTFNTPIELLEFVQKLRTLSGGKPTGFKLSIGHRWEFLAIVKAMLETGILPDFIVVDGAEGGTGAAPLEFSDHLGTPLYEGLLFVHNALYGTRLRERIKIGASGKIVSAFGMVRAMSLGADWCNSARGFMFALGCVQSRSCHTNRCPVGIATQDHRRQRALVVEDKGQRVYNFHRNTLKALAEVIAAAGLDHPAQLRPYHFYLRTAPNTAVPGNMAVDFLDYGELLEDTDNHLFRINWALAQANSFAPLKPLHV